MTAKSDYLEAAIVNWYFRAVAHTPPTTIYVALFTTAPADSGGGTEVTGGSYARQGVVSSPTGSTRWSVPAAGTGLTDNLDTITFPTASAPWGTVVAVGLFDALTAGNLVYYGTLGSPRTVSTSDIARFNAGALDVIES